MLLPEAGCEEVDLEGGVGIDALQDINQLDIRIVILMECDSPSSYTDRLLIVDHSENEEPHVQQDVVTAYSEGYLRDTPRSGFPVFGVGLLTSPKLHRRIMSIFSEECAHQDGGVKHRVQHGAGLVVSGS